jgi:hypothetical protein
MKKKKIKNNKLGLTMSVELIFVILIATIVTMLVVMLVTKNYLNTQKFLCKLTGTCEEKENLIKEVETINVTCEEAKSEIIKHAKLCQEHGNQGTVKETCYVIFLPKDCGPKKDELYNELLNKHKLNTSVLYDCDKKAVIIYNYEKRMVEIK